MQKIMKFAKHSYKTPFLILILIDLFFFSVRPIFAEINQILSANKAAGIYYENNLLSVSIQEYRLTDILKAIANKSTIEIIAADITDDLLTIQFDYIPLEEGLKKLLKERNYVFIYESTGLAKVFVFPKGENLTNNDAIHKIVSAEKAEEKEPADKKENKAQQGLEGILRNVAVNKINVNDELSKALQRILKIDNAAENNNLDLQIFKGLCQNKKVVMQRISELHRKLNLK